MHILILGPSGQLGFELVAQAKAFATVTTAGRTNADEQIDPLDNRALRLLFSKVQPDIVINAIAYTAVDKAETEIDQAFRLNADLPSSLADLCHEWKCLFIHYSTDFVFDGTETRPWKEYDSTNPLSIYGSTKLAGEKAIQLSPCTSFILRTSWVYGARGHNFFLTMLALAREREQLSVVNDQIGSATSSAEIARATLELCKFYGEKPDFVNINQGLYHLTSKGESSWFEFAKVIFELAADHETLIIKDLKAITSEQYPTAAKRPKYSVLDNQLMKDTFNIELPHWRNSLEDCINTYYKEEI